MLLFEFKTAATYALAHAGQAVRHKKTVQASKAMSGVIAPIGVGQIWETSQSPAN